MSPHNHSWTLMYHSDTLNQFFGWDVVTTLSGRALVKVLAPSPPGEGSKQIVFWPKISALLLPPRLVLRLQMLAAVSPVAPPSLHMLTRSSAHTHVTWTWYDTCCRNADWMLRKMTNLRQLCVQKQRQRFILWTVAAFQHVSAQCFGLMTCNLDVSALFTL